MHTTTVRWFIVALLSLLLPLQGALANARAVGMMANGMAAGGHAQSIPVAGKSGAASLESAIVDAHAGHHQPHASAAGASLLTGETKPAHHADKGHRSGGVCDNFGKCCLAGAAAPPLLFPQTAGVAATRIAFTPSTDNVSCFIPDAPDRPPRNLSV